MNRFVKTSLLFALALGLGAQTRYTITTIAGKGSAGFSGDAAKAVDAEFDTPYAVVRDNAGNLYIADQANNRIRKIDASGNITTLAGDGTEFLSGDGGVATKAALINPLGLAVAANGDVYIADSRNHVIRRVVSNGNIERFAGNGNPGFSGDMDTDTATTDPLAVDGTLRRPIGMAFDTAGNLIFADSLNHRIRRVDKDNHLLTLAGTGEAGFSGDGGKATSAKLAYPQGVAVDAAGNIYFADGENHVVRKIATDGIITTVAGNSRRPGYAGDGGKAIDASLFYPRGIARDAQGNLYIADSLNSRIRRVAEDGTITTIAGSGDFDDFGEGGPAEQAALFFPTGIAMGPNGTLYVVDTQNQKIKLLTPRANPVTKPAIAPGGISSASAFGGTLAAGQAAPGSWIEIYGSNFASRSYEWTAESLAAGRGIAELGGVKVTIGGQAAPISFASASQVNVQVPTGLGLGPQEVVVSNAAGTASGLVTLKATLPGLLAPNSLRTNGKAYVSHAAASATVKAGDTITLYGIGFGAVTPAIAAGQIPGQPTSLVATVRFYFGQVEAAVSYAGLAPTQVGLYQFNVVVPNGVNGTAPLTFTLDGQPGNQRDLLIDISR
jgi:uncharacterized protein (TIGR03437 family)